MKYSKDRRTKRIFLGVFFLVLSCLLGCTQNSPVAPEVQNSPDTQFTSRINPVAVAPQLTERIKEDAKANRLRIEKRVFLHETETLEIGKEIWYAQMRIPEGALPSEQRIEMTWEVDTSETVTHYNFRFGPHGLIFRRPVEFVISYRFADLSEEEEDGLAVYYYNEEMNGWEYIGGEVNKTNKTVTVELHHFSRYSLAHS